MFLYVCEVCEVCEPRNIGNIGVKETATIHVHKMYVY